MPNRASSRTISVILITIAAVPICAGQIPARSNIRAQRETEQERHNTARSDSDERTGAPGSLVLNGSGASFPNELYRKWFDEYNKVNDRIRFEYQSIGSGGGIKQISTNTTDFGGTDLPMKDEEIKGAQSEILHIPTTLGATVVIYNLPDPQAELRLTPEALAGIFLGNVKKWNDELIASANRELTLPAREISVVHRSDGSTPSYVWTDYLSKVSPKWKEKIGTGIMVNWPTGVGAKGNEGVAEQVKSTPYSIGYVEFSYAERNNLRYATIENQAGAFIKPSIDSITAAAASAEMPDDLRTSITDSPGVDAYPISSFTYLLVPKHQRDKAKGRALVAFVSWCLRDGQTLARELHYAPLPENVIDKAEQVIRLIE